MTFSRPRRRSRHHRLPSGSPLAPACPPIAATLQTAHEIVSEIVPQSFVLSHLLLFPCQFPRNAR